MAMPGFLVESPFPTASVTAEVSRGRISRGSTDEVVPQLRIDPWGGGVGGTAGFSWPSRCEWRCNIGFSVCLAACGVAPVVCAACFAALDICLDGCYNPGIA